MKEILSYWDILLGLLSISLGICRLIKYEKYRKKRDNEYRSPYPAAHRRPQKVVGIVCGTDGAARQPESRKQDFAGAHPRTRRRIVTYATDGGTGG